MLVWQQPLTPLLNEFKKLRVRRKIIDLFKKKNVLCPDFQERDASSYARVKLTSKVRPG